MSSGDLQHPTTDFDAFSIDLIAAQQESYHRLLELEVLYRTASIGLGFVDCNMRYVRLNQVLAEINGLTIEAHLGQHASEINAPLSQSLIPIIAGVLASKQPHLNLEIRDSTRLDAVGERTWLASFYPVANDETVGVSIAFHDATVTTAREDIQRRFKLIVESSDDAMVSFNLSGAITGWNRAAEEMFCYSASEALGTMITSLAAPGREGEIPDVLARLQRDEPAGHYETVQRRKDGHLIDVWLTVSLIYDSCGSVIGASTTARDISAHKRDHAALLRSNDELRQLAFAAAHDLQEPLRNIDLYAQVLELQNRDNGNSETDQSLAIVLGSARRMQTLIKDLLLYTDAVDLHVSKKQAADCNAACRAALQHLDSEVRYSTASVNIAPLPNIAAEYAHLVQLFQYLIDNALKYRSSERPLRIDISAEIRGHDWVFSVKDNGIGIASQYHARIFDVFKRLHGRDVPGTGIGLAICKRIVNHYGGHLWVESSLGCGSTFSFSFPLESSSN